MPCRTIRTRPIIAIFSLVLTLPPNGLQSKSGTPDLSTSILRVLQVLQLKGKFSVSRCAIVEDAFARYPSDNCFAQYGTGTPRDPQTMFPTYLTHQSGQHIVSSYLNSTSYAQTVGKPFVMFETNTASCGGFPGVSDLVSVLPCGLWITP